MNSNKYSELAGRRMMAIFFWLFPLLFYLFIDEPSIRILDALTGHYIFIFLISAIGLDDKGKHIFFSFLQLIVSSYLLIIFLYLLYEESFSYIWLIVTLFNVYIIFLNYVEYHHLNEESYSYTTKELNIAAVVVACLYVYI
ncbi:hypothetical protein H4J56_18280 [Colwellia sp. BRX8-4]|uniref:hypothetical protein n=1 Tax=Colwellia sp. BRX8-4 TaxID=2759836 RepID=UPI0015F6D07B|nr:hypothetical protein [Colwellia sp. BRX8-4]MBA6373367.1 hypothetical protein [Colwellia sp. BRX8-4]